MGTGSFYKSDLPALFNYTQNSASTYTTSVIIEFLREFFSKDSEYHYSRDQWGFANTPDHTGLPFNAGLNDDITTRLFIGEPFRQNVQFYPAIIVKNGGFRSVPISISRNKFNIKYENIKYIDGYNEETIIKRPVSYEQAGAWEGSIIIEILTRSSIARSELIDLISIFFVDTNFEISNNAGVVVKALTVGGVSESEDRNDKMFRQSITLDVRTEWRRSIPISNVVDIINFCIEIGDTDQDPFVPANNLTIHQTIELSDLLD